MNGLMISQVVWNTPDHPPLINDGEMVPVILQVRGKVFGGWYLKRYLLATEHEAIEGVIDWDEDSGDSFWTGFFDRVWDSHYDEYFDHLPLNEIEFWASMPDRLYELRRKAMQ